MHKSAVPISLKSILLLSVLIVSCSSPIHDSKSKTESPAISKTEEIDTSYHEGDIVFQTSGSGQSLAIQLATKSPFSHCGIILRKGGQLMIFEAVQPVKFTPIDKWIKQGDDNYYVVKRLSKADSIINASTLNKMHEFAKQNEGKDYDLPFEWDDQKMYCSELVYKIYLNSAGIEIGKTAKMKDFDLTSPIVQKIMKQRYGEKVPMDQEVISPSAIFDSPLLFTVKEVNKP
jgi:uncharacterized protein YycO